MHCVLADHATFWSGSTGVICEKEKENQERTINESKKERNTQQYTRAYRYLMWQCEALRAECAVHPLRYMLDGNMHVLLL